MGTYLQEMRGRNGPAHSRALTRLALRRPVALANNKNRIGAFRWRDDTIHSGLFYERRRRNGQELSRIVTIALQERGSNGPRMED